MATGTTRFESYEQARDEHSWDVPERYNIAVDVCDKHPPDQLAMIHEHFDGTVREVRWGELQADANRFADVLGQHGVGKGDRVAMLLPPTPETAAAFFGTWKRGAILLSMSVLYGDDGIRHRVKDSQAKVLVTNADNADRIEPELVDEILILDRDLLDSGDDAPILEDTLADDPAQLYYSSGTTGLAKGILHAHRYLLGHEEFVYCHDVQPGERFHGMGEWAWAAGIAPLLGPWRLGAVQVVYQREGGFDPHKQLDVLSRHEVTNVFTTPTAMRSMMGIGDAGTRYPQKFRIVCSAGEPLNPEAIRWFREQYGLTVLDYYGLTESYPLVANYPSWTCGRARWAGRCRAGTCRSSTRTSSPSRPASAARSACARARTRTIRSATGTTRRRRRRRSAGTGSTPRTPPAPTRTATSGTRAGPTT